MSALGSVLRRLAHTHLHDISDVEPQFAVRPDAEYLRPLNHICSLACSRWTIWLRTSASTSEVCTHFVHPAWSRVLTHGFVLAFAEADHSVRIILQKYKTQLADQSLWNLLPGTGTLSAACSPRRVSHSWLVSCAAQRSLVFLSWRLAGARRSTRSLTRASPTTSTAWPRASDPSLSPSSGERLCLALLHVVDCSPVRSACRPRVPCLRAACL